MESVFFDILEFLFSHFDNHPQHRDLQFPYLNHLNISYIAHHLIHVKNFQIVS